MYNQEKDKLIKLFEYCDQDKGSSLLLSIMQYENSNPKLQITRMYSKKNGEKGYSSSGRLTKNEVEFIKDNIDEILQYLST